jgi:hypothetical protein
MAQRVLEVLKTANKVLSGCDLAARCLVARKDGNPCTAFGRPNTAEPHRFQAPSSGAGGRKRGWRRLARQTHTLAPAWHVDGVVTGEHSSHNRFATCCSGGTPRPPLAAGYGRRSLMGQQGQQTARGPERKRTKSPA